jgi:hypothetical protein
MAVGCALATTALSGTGLLTSAATAVLPPGEYWGYSTLVNHYTEEQRQAALDAAYAIAYRDATSDGYDIATCVDTPGSPEIEFNVKSFKYDVFVDIYCTK